MTERERCLLVYLTTRPGVVVSRDTLLAEVWGYSDQVITRAADNVVRRLREKIEADPGEPRHLLTSFGAGYRFEPVRSTPSDASLPAPTSARRRLVFGDRVADLDRAVVERPGATAVALTANEVALLDRLDRAGGGIVDRATLSRAVWGQTSRQARAIDHALHRLRLKVEAEPDEPIHLLTVRGHGFRLVVGTPAADRVLTTLVQAALGDADTDWDRGVDASSVTQVARWLATEAVGGVEVGDGWRFAFADPAAALAFALAALDRAPRPAPLRVAVHRGRPIVWTDPVTGRVCAVGPEVHRVQDLVLRAPGDAALVDAGVWGEVGEGTGRAGVPVAHGAVQVGGRTASEVRPAKLPWASGRYLGDRARVRAVRDQLASSRAVTLVGFPGVGKSRLALEVCAEAPVPVHHVALGEARTAGAALGPIAGALGAVLTVGDPVEQLREVLADSGPLWLWLDDVDLAIDVARAAVGRWLEAVPTLHVLATSRRALGAPGEVVIEVEPLDEDAATAMLLDRVPDADPDEARALARTLDGLPLAIELAAARAATMAVPALTARMGDRLRLLRTGPAGRHGSMRAALDVSWDGLDRHEQRALARCAVFRGGFDLEAAEVVLDLGDADAPWAIDLVEALVRHHLVRVGDDGYALPDSVGAYAAERLAADRAEGEEAERTHARWFAQLGAPELLRAIERDPTGDAARRRVQVVPNLLAALERAHAAGDPALAADLALALGPVWVSRGPLSEGVALLERVAALGGPRGFEVRSLAEWMRSLGGDLATARDALGSLVSAEGAGPGDLSRARLRHARVVVLADGARVALPLLERLLDDARAQGELDVVCGVLMDLGVRGPTHTTVPRLEQAIALARRIGNVQVERSALRVLGIAERDRGNVERARELVELALERNRRALDVRGEAMSLHALGNLCLDDPPVAAARFRAAARLARRIGERRVQMMCVGALGSLSFNVDDPVAAAGHFTEAIELAQRLGSRLDLTVYEVNLGVALAAQGRPDAAAHLREGLAESIELELPNAAAWAAVTLAALEPDPA
ncbi:MAG: winged helix-turn-helix domain-containing protein, partial [Myxococcota bacterium]